MIIELSNYQLGTCICFSAVFFSYIPLDMATSPMPVRGCELTPTPGTYGLKTERNLYRATSDVRTRSLDF